MGPGSDAGPICSFSATSDPNTVVDVQIYPDAQSLAQPKGHIRLTIDDMRHKMRPVAGQISSHACRSD